MGESRLNVKQAKPWSHTLPVLLALVEKIGGEMHSSFKEIINILSGSAERTPSSRRQDSSRVCCSFEYQLQNLSTTTNPRILQNEREAEATPRYG